MRVPVSWFKEYVDWTGTVEELAELLTMSGTEVEGIDWVGAPRDPENLARFVVGRVMTHEKHPNADKLSLCMVDVGEPNGRIGRSSAAPTTSRSAMWSPCRSRAPYSRVGSSCARAPSAASRAKA